MEKDEKLEILFKHCEEYRDNRTNSQISTKDQLKILYSIANRLGLYDAADRISVLI